MSTFTDWAPTPVTDTALNEDDQDVSLGLSDTMTMALLTTLHGAEFMHALRHGATGTYYGPLSIQRIEERRFKTPTGTYPGLQIVIDGHRYRLPIVYAGLDGQR